jgi:hypothetical protein
LEIASARFRSAGDASVALKRDVEEYTRRDDYGVRSARLPEIGDESAAASGRVNLGYRGSRVASVWLRHGPVVTRFQGVMVASDPLPVVQTLAEQVAKRTG